MAYLIQILSTFIFLIDESPSPKSENTKTQISAEYDENGALRLRTGPHSTLRIGGYVETFYSYNFNKPSNGLTNYRAFDNRHNAITLQNIALDTEWNSQYIFAHLAFQAGHAPATYYGVSEPSMPGFATGVSSSSASLWQYVQQANLGVYLPTKIPFTIDAGLFLSPIGPESLATHENWTWSHTPLFFALPFYHVGIRGGVKVHPNHFLRLGLYNGWNNIVDNNKEKSLALEYVFDHSEQLKITTVYFSGVERARNAPEGRAWRHTLDAYLQSQFIHRMALLVHACAGIEPNHFGLSWWTVGSLGFRVRALDWLYFTGQGAVLYEHRPRNEEGLAEAILLPSSWLAVGMFTADFRFVNHLSVKLEYRHDHAPSEIFFRGDIQGDGSSANSFVPNAIAQNTLTVGATAWF